MKCHIIGNGYSRDLFEGTEDFKICLNVHSYDCDLLFAVDDIAIDYLLANNFYGKNVVISDHRKLEHEKIVDDISMEFYNLLGHALHLHCKEICFSSFDHPRLDLLLEMKPNYQKC